MKTREQSRTFGHQSKRKAGGESDSPRLIGTSQGRDNPDSFQAEKRDVQKAIGHDPASRLSLKDMLTVCKGIACMTFVREGKMATSLSPARKFKQNTLDVSSTGLPANHAQIDPKEAEPFVGYPLFFSSI